MIKEWGSARGSTIATFIKPSAALATNTHAISCLTSQTSPTCTIAEHE